MLIAGFDVPVLGWHVANSVKKKSYRGKAI